MSDDSDEYGGVGNGVDNGFGDNSLEDDPKAACTGSVSRR